ncbi:MAG: pyridoxamine 5'-phosphate oxidase family protein [Treponema sp.]
MTRTYEFLKKAGTFYLATVDHDQPRVRPFGAVCIYGGKLYITTSNKKNCFRQMLENPKVEISGMAGNEWIRLTCEVVRDESVEAKKAMLEENPSLKSMYAVDDGKFEVLYLKNAAAVFNTFGKEPAVEKF